MASKQRILLLGNGPTSLSALQSLVEEFPVVGVCRDVADEHRGDDPVVRLAHAKTIPVQLDTTLPAVEVLIKHLRPDCVVVSSYDRILPKALLESCKFVNVHYAPLPCYRGRASVNWAIINGERCTAVTIHELVAGLDAGGVLFQRFVAIEERDTVTGLYERLNEIQRDNLADAVRRYVHGERGVAQDDAGATYGCTRLPEDGEVDWSATTQEIHRLIRALTDPYPGAYTHLGGARLVIRRAEPVADPPVYAGRIPGRVIAVNRIEGFVDVLTGDGVLRLVEVQLVDGPKEPPARVIKSVRTTLGLRMEHLLGRIARLEAAFEQMTQAGVASGKG